MSRVDQNLENNSTVILKKGINGNYIDPQNGSNFLLPQLGTINKRVYIVTKSSFNICNLIEFLMSELNMAFPESNIYVKQIGIDIKDLNQKRTYEQAEVNGRTVSTKLTGCTFLTAQTIGSAYAGTIGVSVGAKETDDYAVLDGVKRDTVLQKEHYSLFDNLVDSSVIKSIDPTTTDNEYYLIVRKEKDGSVDLKNQQMVFSQQYVDVLKHNIDVVLYSQAQLCTRSSELLKYPPEPDENDKHYKRQLPLQVRTNLEKVEYYKEVEKADRGSILPHSYIEPLNQSNFAIISNDRLVRIILDKTYVDPDYKVACYDPVLDCGIIEVKQNPDYWFSFQGLNANLTATFLFRS